MISRRDRLVVVAMLSLTWLVVVAAPVAHAQVKLEYKFPEGKTLTYKTNSRARQVLTFMGMEVESVKRETKEWSRSFGKRRGDSSLPIEEQIRSLRVDYTLPGGVKLTMDSGKPDLKFDNAQLSLLGEVFKLESMIGYVVVLDKVGAVKAIEGTEKLREKVERVDSPVAREEFLSQIATDRLKSKFEQELHVLPDVLARPSEPWERNEILEINGKLFAIRTKYEYRGPEKKGDKTLEKISSKVLSIKYDQDPNSKLPVKVVKNDIKVESSEGSILFDREEGHPVSTTARIRVKGELSYSAAGVEQSGAFDLSFETNTQFQPVAK